MEGYIRPIKGKLKFGLFAIAMVSIAVAERAFSLYYYSQFDFLTMQSRPVASNFDVPDADLMLTTSGPTMRFEVTIPNQAPLSSGNSLVMLVFGNATTGTLSRVAFGTFGAEARIGGSAPLDGTGGVVLETIRETKVGNATATSLLPLRLK